MGNNKNYTHIKSEDEFNKLLKKGNLREGYFEVNFEVTISTSNIPNDQEFFINNIIFNQRVNLDFENHDIQVNFYNCGFKKSLRANKLNIHGLSLEKVNLPYLLLNRATIFKKINIKNESFIKNIIITNSHYNGGLVIDNSEVNELSFSISEIKTAISSLNIRGSKIYESIRFNNVTFTDFFLQDSEILCDFAIEKSIINQRFIVENSSTTGNLSILKSSITNLFFTNSKFKNVFLILSGIPKEEENELSNYKFGKITLLDTSFTERIIIQDPWKKDDKLSIRELTLRLNSSPKGEFLINEINLGKLTLTGKNYDAELTFDDTKINEIVIDNFSNYRTLSFFNLCPINQTHYKKFFVQKSNLGRTQFHYCDLAAYKENIYIVQTNLIDIIPTGVRWFGFEDFLDYKLSSKTLMIILRNKIVFLYYYILKGVDWPEFKFSNYYKITNYFYPWLTLGNKLKYAFYNVSSDDKDLEKYRQQRELFRQLKTVMERQANRIQALQFKQYEMQAYRQELIRLKRFWSRERIVLWANQSNNHGQNWWKPILLALGFSFVLISFIVFSFSGEWWSFKAISEYIQHYPRMMNPAFSLENIFGGDNTFSFCTNFWALLQRVSMSFFIYQTVVAFRKYGRG